MTSIVILFRASSFLFGQFFFKPQSLHPMAEYHGAARAVGGCAIYVRYSLKY